MRILSWLVTVPFSLFALWFALSNRSEATLSLEFTDISFTAPFFVFIGVAFVSGFFGGAFMLQLKRIKDKYHVHTLTKSNAALLTKIAELTEENAENTEKTDDTVKKLPGWAEKPFFFKKQSDIIADTKQSERKPLL